MQEDRCTVRLQMRVPRDIADDLDAIASDLGLTRSAALRFLVRQYAQQHQRAQPASYGRDYDPPIGDQ